MAVDRGLLWSVLDWWVWVVTALAAVVTLVVLVLGVVRRSRPVLLPGLPFYLDETRVIELCQQGGYGDIAQRAIREFVRRSTDGSFGFTSQWFKFGRGGNRGHETETSYNVHVTANSLLGMALKSLEAQHGVVHANLTTRVVQGDRAWRRTRSPLLSEVHDGYVVVQGRFTVAEETAEEVVLHARIGDCDARVRVACHDDHLRRKEVPQGQFNARCLGKSQAWRPDSGELVILPIAVLQ
ncbi:hypothetical protein Q5425_29040 [Amycolatopsis sp. A133]|uniref:hypothetical protein n=1 Tax=Amycolatopsis sp. A133 TaxID=3064472 RepID=UPI0027FC3904|nr:hypothetical protein [Amycolatopsis sp. A133]MDQ7807801.1 hypothetical protein [Amycolatopsis sp. A133]